MAFKPLTSKKPDALATNEVKQPPSYQSLDEIKKTTEERIYLIFDDSGSMSATVPGSGDPALSVTNSYNAIFNHSDKPRIVLAQEATVDYMKNCKPHVSAVEVAPLNETAIPLTKNLPVVAAKVQKIEATGGTPLYKAMGKLVDKHKESKFTRALIFTDGEATDSNYLTGSHSWEDRSLIGGRPTLFAEVAEMNIPIDLILIGDMTEANLSQNTRSIKELCEKSGGTFLICKDGKSFKEKMKYFAPLLRHMLPQIASKDNFKGE